MKTQHPDATALMSDSNLVASLKQATVSYQIADKPNRLVPLNKFSPIWGSRVPLIQKDMFDTRVLMQNALKYVFQVPIFNLHRTYARAYDNEYWERLVNDPALAREYDAITNLHRSFASHMNLPVDLITLENSTGAFVVYIDPQVPDGILFRMFYNAITGIALNPMTFVMYPKESDHEGFMKVRAFDALNYPGFERDLAQRWPEGEESYYKSPIHRWACIAGQNVAQALLLINAANTDIHHYELSRKECARIPKVLQRLYDYFVVDAFRMRKEITSWDDVTKLMNLTASVEEMQTVLDCRERGVMRSFKGQLFWWNPALRKAR